MICVTLLIAMALNLGILKGVDGTRRAFILHSGDDVHGYTVRSCSIGGSHSSESVFRDSLKREQLDRNILNDANLLIVLDTDMFSFWNVNIDLSGEIEQF